MKTGQLYFKDEDSTNCYPLGDHINEAKEEGLTEITLIEAILAPNDEFVWCAYMGEVMERFECNKSECSRYKPSHSKGGVCQHRGRYFEFGEKETFKVV